MTSIKTIHSASDLDEVFAEKRDVTIEVLGDEYTHRRVKSELLDACDSVHGSYYRMLSFDDDGEIVCWTVTVVS